MQNNFFCKNLYLNLYERPSFKSKISSQILYGEKFKILLKKKGWLKIRTSFDRYVGYIKKGDDSFGLLFKNNNLHIEIIDNVGNRTEYKTTFYRKSN